MAWIAAYTLRHSVAVGWLESSVHITAVADLLGHRGVSLSGDVYGHASDDTARAAVDGLEWGARTVNGLSDSHENAPGSSHIGGWRAYGRSLAVAISGRAVEKSGVSVSPTTGRNYAYS